jgi:hypothetical protein
MNFSMTEQEKSDLLLIQVTAWAGLTVYKYLYTEDNLHKLILYIHHTYFCNGHGTLYIQSSV